MTGCESKMATTRSREGQTGKVESLAVEKDDGIEKPSAVGWRVLKGEARRRTKANTR